LLRRCNPMPQTESPEGVDRSPASISEPSPHTHTHKNSTTPTAPPTPPPNALLLTEDQQALVRHLHGYGFVGAVGFVRQMPNAAIWDAVVEVDMMGREEREGIRSLGALIRQLVREACREGR